MQMPISTYTLASAIDGQIYLLVDPGNHTAIARMAFKRNGHWMMWVKDEEPVIFNGHHFIAIPMDDIQTVFEDV